MKSVVQNMRVGVFVLAGLFFLGCLAGCTTDKELERLNREQATTIQGLQAEIARLNQELDELLESRQQLSTAKDELEKRLQKEMASGDLSISMEDRGLVVTVLDRVLFDSGKAELKESSTDTLSKVADILRQKVGEHVVYVEGHTDNEPIRYSGWRSNWELSTARATEVIHYFIAEGNFDPRRLVATGYGEFQPVAENDTAKGRMNNRRVEIVISPKKLVAAGVSAAV